MSLTAFPVQAEKGRWKQRTGKGYQMCDALLREVNRYDYSQVKGATESCTVDLVIPHAKSFR